MKIAYFAPIYFDDLKQRPQHLAEILAEKHEVYYIEPTISSMKYILKRGTHYSGKKYDINSNLHVIRVSGLLTVHKSLEALDFFHLNILSEKIQLKEVLRNCSIIWIGYSGWYYLIQNIKNKLIIYDKMDDNIQLSKQYLLKCFLKQVENKLINKADIVFATCQKFYDEIKPVKNHTFIIRNGLPKEFINEVVFCSDKKKSKTVFGYIGTISDWFDYETIRTILAGDPNCEVIIIGKRYTEQYLDKRVHYINEVPKKDVPAYINSFDICLYPFKRNSFVDTINPVKLYEYLMFNKPILAVKSAETCEFSKYCMIYDDYSMINELCSNPKIPFQSEEELKMFIEKNSWQARGNELEKCLNDTILFEEKI